MKFIVKALMCCTLFGAAAVSHAAKNYCGELKSHYGPFDYRSANGAGFPIVEDNHFTEVVQNGTGGVTGPIGGDLSYTLIVIPNHPRALSVIGNVSVRMKTPQLPGALYPTECYFERAIRFAPDDGVGYAAYGNYLVASGQPAKALSMLKRAANLDPENATFNYNLGLVYMKLKDYDNAEIYAEKAYGLGFPLQGLRNQLTAVGKRPTTPR